MDRFIALALLVTAASHVLRPKEWALFFKKLVESQTAGLAIGIFTLPTGLALLLTRTDWSWGWGWVFIGLGLAYTLKGSFYLLAPGLAERVIREKGSDWQNYRLAGAVMLVLGVPLTWLAFTPAS